MALYREIRPGDTLRIGDTVIVAESKSGRVTRLRIDTALPVHQVKAAQAAPAPSAPEPPQEPRKPMLFRSPVVTTAD